MICVHGFRLDRLLVVLVACFGLAHESHAEVKWHWNGPPAGDPMVREQITSAMNFCVSTWNANAEYEFDIGTVYGTGTPTADAGYLGQIRFGGMRGWWTSLHESSHWLGTGSTWQWAQHQRFGTWNGTYASNIRRAFDGPGEVMGCDNAHYWPYGANNGNGENGARMVGLIGAFRRDMNLPQGDRTVGIAPGTYRLRNRQNIKMLDSMASNLEGTLTRQSENGPGNSQQWEVGRVEKTKFFTIKSVASGKYLDAGGMALPGSPVRQTSPYVRGLADSQQWEIVPTNSFFFKLVNKATRKVLCGSDRETDGANVVQNDPATAPTQEWTFVHPMVQLAPPPGVISQGRPTRCSSTGEGHHEWKGNNGVVGDRWTASDGKYPQWWRVDLGSTQPITKVAIDWFPDHAPTFQYLLEISDDDATYTTVADRRQNNVSGTTTDALSGIKGRYLRVTVTGTTGGWAAFMECRVYNEAQPMKLLSQFRHATASSEQDGNLAVNAADVDPTFTRWCAANPKYPAWWQVDLGSVQRVSKAVIQWFDEDGRSYKYRIEGSTDGTSFTPLIDRRDNQTPSVTTDTFSGLARYVRVVVTGGSTEWPSFYDVQIYGPATLAQAVAPGSPGLGGFNR